MNLALRFLLEICLLVALAVWGFQTGTGALRWVLGLGAPAVAATLWGVWIAPASSRRLPMPGRLVGEAVLFGAGMAGLVAAGQPGWAALFAALVVVNWILLVVWKQ